MRRIKDALKVLFRDNYMLITEEGGNPEFSMEMPAEEAAIYAKAVGDALEEQNRAIDSALDALTG